MACLLMVIPPENFRDEELFETRTVLEWAGHRTVLASTRTGLCAGSQGGAAKSELLLDHVRSEDYDGVVFVGGGGSAKLFDNPDALHLAAAMHAQGMFDAASCLAPVHLAIDGDLAGRRDNVSGTEVATLQAKGAIYTGPGVTVDGNIVTGNGPKASKEFARSIDTLLHHRQAA